MSNFAVVEYPPKVNMNIQSLYLCLFPWKIGAWLEAAVDEILGYSEKTQLYVE
jgi:hypothetical protein